MEWHPQLADQHQVQANLQGRGNFIGNRHAATGQGENDDIGSMSVFEQRLHQPPTGINPVTQDGLR
jgi:hypothetical protein